MKKFLLLIIFLLFVGIGWLGWKGFQLNQDFQYRSPVEKVLKIERGAGIFEISNLLQREGIIANAQLFRWIARYQGDDKKLKAGKYQFEPGLAIPDVIRKLVAGETVFQVLTIPEGLPLNRSAHLVSEIGLSPERFLALATDSAFVHRLGIPASTLEGYLFPETYHLPDEIDELSLIQHMVSEFKENFPAAYQKRAADLGLNRHEVVTLASIIEGEARVDSERATISAVYHNRLQRGQRLEADPTVQYALGEWKSRLLYKDLEVDSPYNTYRYAGLPPGPINSPGAASIRAALYPADVDYLYFVARGDGSHIFSHTLAEHNRARREVKRNSR